MREFHVGSSSRVCAKLSGLRVLAGFSCDPHPASERDTRVGPTLRIVAFNDVYTLENLPRLKTLVAHYRESAPADALLVTIAGDFVSPSLLSSLDHGLAMVDCLNEVGVTHAVFGNHEDDVPGEELHKRVAELRATCLGTNLRGYDVRMPASDIVDVQGASTRAVRVGLVGVVLNDPTIYRRPPFDGRAIVPANVAALEETQRLLRDEGCTSVIPLTHQTILDDRRLAHEQRDPPYPVILGGHEHTLFIEEVDRTWIVKASSEGIRAVIVDLEWAADAPALRATDVPRVRVTVDDVSNYAEDPALRARVDSHLHVLEEIEGTTLVALGPSEVLSSVGTRSEQTSLGALLATRIRVALGADLVFVNGGGVRGSREYRERFTYADLRNEVPFDNELVVVALPGRVVQEAFAASRAPERLPHGGFFQVDDGVVVGEGNALLRVDGAPFDARKTYRVAFVRNLLLGLDHNGPLVAYARDFPEEVPREDSGRDIKLVLVEAFARCIWEQLGPFAKLDRDHDGKVSAEELRQAMADLGGKEPTMVARNLVMGALDIDRDGQISEDEAQSS